MENERSRCCFGLWFATPLHNIYIFNIVRVLVPLRLPPGRRTPFTATAKGCRDLTPSIIIISHTVYYHLLRVKLMRMNEEKRQEVHILCHWRMVNNNFNFHRHHICFWIFAIIFHGKGIFLYRLHLMWWWCLSDVHEYLVHYSVMIIKNGAYKFPVKHGLLFTAIIRKPGLMVNV